MHCATETDSENQVYGGLKKPQRKWAPKESRDSGKMGQGKNEHQHSPTHVRQLPPASTPFLMHRCTGLFEMIFGVLTTCHKQYT